MQIVRDLAGYSYGRSDLVRRAMSKKKADVMEKERKNFVYGNEEEGVKGCIANGIDEKVANKIYDEMIDFAKYAFNKSHAAAYAVVAYQTAYLKCYYPVEYMAALLTSILDNTNKVSEYSLHCRQLGIDILPPDINEGEGNFSVSGNHIRYGLSAIKGLGRPVMDAIVAEREAGGKYTSLKDFATRLSGKEVNKRTVENFIKAGAMDSLPGTRRQKMAVYAAVLDNITQEKKKNLEGQMSLFDFASDDQKEKYEVRMPEVGEYDKEQLLAFEKEVLGIYISGHPLDDYRALWEKNITHTTLDFVLDEETGLAKVRDGQQVILGGMISGKTVKATRNNSMMAFITLEDLLGTTEVIIFPRDYENNKALLELDSKVFIYGKVTVEEEKAAKVICQRILPFDQIPKEIWIKFSDKEEFVKSEQKLYEILRESDGKDRVSIYLECEKAIKHLPKNYSVKADGKLLEKLYDIFSQENIKVVEKSIEKMQGKS